MSDRMYRSLLIGLGAALVAVVALAVWLTPQGSAPPLPEPLESVFPRPNDTILQQSRLEIHLEVGYQADIRIDGLRVPPDELTFVESTGTYRWRPGPGRLFEVWSPGDHSVLVSWSRVIGLPKVGSFEWTFRVQ